jgi:excisionase family DNA binding protein
MATSSPPELLTFAEVTAELRLSAPSVRKLVAAGQLPVIRLSGSLRFRRADLDALLDPTHEREQP